MVGQPFDTIKTRLQVLGKGTIGAAGMPPEMVYNNGMDCVRKMVRHWQPMQQHACFLCFSIGTICIGECRLTCAVQCCMDVSIAVVLLIDLAYTQLKAELCSCCSLP
jgi:hypothetical protein